MIWTAGISALCLLICLPCFMHYKKALRYRLAAAFKVAGTLCAAVMALTAALRLDPRCWICFAALVLHASADYLLEFHLWAGAGLFLAGHICEIAFFTSLCPPTLIHLICVACLLAFTAYLVFVRWKKQIGPQLPMFLIYGVSLCLMCACAVGCLGAHTLQGLLIAVGGALFYLSDTLLCCRLLFSATRAVDWTIMITYYAAQLLFGLACLL